MRKAQRRQIEELLGQMGEAHGEIKNFIEQGNAMQSMNLLEECQNAAIAIGTLIENTEGEGHPAVTVLEEYCELIYQIYENLMPGSSVNANKTYKFLKQKLIKAANSIKNNIKIRREVVFLPYKASMWDSLESVWKAVDADPDCDAYVVPIPYFDKNPDGSFKEEHYEGKLYPKYVPVTRYDEFDFRKHMPDVIYIHNGYDGWNLVTSVHPDFYSQNLKKYTEELVYIPYFVLGEIDPDNERAVEGMKHFCFLPGIINADKVIVQSENMKKIYVREYIKAAKEYGLTGKHLDRAYLEKKFLGTGSPKFDKVLNTKKEDLEIPNEWMEIIKKPDGSFKKIVFYNTSIGALLRYNEKILRKIEDVFRVFEENKEITALLWRPHPLIKATIESMRPQFWEAYDKLVRKYREEGWGIYDESADLDRAVILSDAYYGDSSSVLQLCRKAGMPVMIQNVEISDKAEFELTKTDRKMYGFDIMKYKTYKLYFNDLAVSNQKEIAYGSAGGFNGLFEIELDTGRCKYIGLFPNEKLSQEFIHLSAVYCQRKAFFFPHRGNYISVYDMNSQNIIQINLDKCDYPYYSKNFKIGEVFAHKNKVFAVGATYPYVLVINADTLETTFIPIETGGRPIFFRTGSCQVRNHYYIPSLKGGIILEIDPATESVKSHFWGTEDDGAWSMAFDGEKFWLTPHTGEEGFRIWEPGNGIVQEITDFPEGYQGGNLPYTYCFCIGKEILYTPFEANMMIKLDTEEKKIKKVEQSIFLGGKISGISFRIDSYVFLKIRMGEESWYAQTGKDLCVNMRTLEQTEYAFTFCKKREQYFRDVAYEIKKMPFWSNVMKENEKISLEEFLKVISK